MKIIYCINDIEYKEQQCEICIDNDFVSNTRANLRFAACWGNSLKKK